MLKKIEIKEKKHKIIQKINSFLSYCYCVLKLEENYLQQEKIINSIINKEIDIEEVDIYVDAKKDYCYKTIYIIDIQTQVEKAKIKLPNIF